MFFKVQKQLTLHNDVHQGRKTSIRSIQIHLQQKTISYFGGISCQGEKSLPMDSKWHIPHQSFWGMLHPLLWWELYLYLLLPLGSVVVFFGENFLLAMKKSTQVFKWHIWMKINHLLPNYVNASSVQENCTYMHVLTFFPTSALSTRNWQHASSSVT